MAHLPPGELFLGGAVAPRGGATRHYHLPTGDLTTHGVVLGMTGSGKTGLLMVTVEEALRAGVPAILIDVKGDLPNLLLALPHFEGDALLPWVESHATSPEATRSLAHQRAREREEQLHSWGLGRDDLDHFASTVNVRVLTPGSTAGEPLHILSSLERRASPWDVDPEASRAALSAAVSLVLRLLGRDSDPAKSRD